MSNKTHSPVIFIVGPTCIGKSEFAINLAKRINGEIINADSMQVYSNLRILTARPELKEQKKIPHHLYGYVDGSIRYNVATWCNDVLNILEKNINEKKHSIVVGGTGMYIEKFINGLVQMPSIPEKIKNESENFLENYGIEKLRDEVIRIDKDASKKISLNDINRLRRIWEVYKYTKKNLTFWKKNKNKKFLSNKNFVIYLFTPNREQIYNRVNKRFSNMINSGAIEEVKNLLELDLPNSFPIMRAHGVPEIINFLSGSLSIEECILKGQLVTRHYVKRQLSWWRTSNLKIAKKFDKFPLEIDINSLKIR